MKKTLFLLLILLGFHTVNFAQEHKGYSIKIGLGKSDIINDHCDTNGQPIYSVRFGGSYEFPINKLLGIEPGLQFTQKGAKEISKFNGVNLENKMSFKLYYLEIPISAVFHLSAFSFNIGPYFCYRFNQQEGSVPEEYLENWDFGFQSGLKYNINKVFVGLEGSVGYPGHIWRAQTWSDHSEPGLRSLNFGFIVGCKL